MDFSDQEIASELSDHGDVPLADLRVMSDPALSSAVRRIVPDTAGQSVPVATFNSAI
jgi:FXSXX-COOH protein